MKAIQRIKSNLSKIIKVLRHGILSLYSYIRKIIPWRSRTSTNLSNSPASSLSNTTRISHSNSISSYIRSLRNIRIAGLSSSFLFGLLALAIIIPLYNVSGAEDTEATTEACANSGDSSLGTNCSITFTSTRDTATAEITPTANPVTTTDNFASSIPNTTDAAFSIGTNNAQGYDLKISSSAGTTLKPSTTATTDESITALTTSTGITKESTSFTNNTWGYLPSYYNSTANTDKYYPITTSTTTLRTTSSANPTNTYDDYTIGIGAKVDMSRTAGTYTLSGNTSNPGSITLSYVANPTGYEITYADNSGDSTVSNMPTAKQSGAVSATSIALAPNRTPTRTGYSLTGWCLGEVTSSGTTCSGTTIATNGSLALDRTATSNKAILYAIWTPNQYSCRKHYRLQNDDGSFPSSYTADGSELVSYNDTCTYSKSYNYYKGSANGTNNEQVTKTATMNSTSGIDIYMDLYRNTYSLTVSAGSNTSSATGSGTYRWGQTVSVGVTASSNTTCLTYGTPSWAQGNSGGTIGSTSSNGNVYTMNYTMPKNAASLTASSNSTRGTYTISYNANGGSGTTMSNTTASCGASTALRTNTYTRTGYTFLGWSTSSTATSATYTTSINLSRTTDLILYAVWSADPVTYSATIYYNASPTNGDTDIKSTTISCDTVTDSSCSPTIPDAVKNSVGTYNNAYAGLANRTGTMSASSSVTLNSSTNGNTYYSVYRSSIKIYAPSSTSDLTSNTRYRNQWFANDSELSTTVLSSSSTGTSNFTQTATVSTDYNFIGFSTSSSSNSTSYSSVSSLAATNRTSDTYAVYGRSYTATFYYNNHTSCSSGTSSVTSTPKTAIQYLRPTGTSSSSVELSDSDYSTPTGSLGTYCNALAGWATSTGTMTTTTPQTPTTTYYAVYSSSVTLYKPSSTTARTSVTLYRNQTLSSTTAMGTTYLASNSSTLSNYSYSSSISGYTLYGIATSYNTSSTTYGNISGLASSTYTTAYAVDYDSDALSATFYYNNKTTTTCTTTASVTSTTGYGARYAYTTSSAATTSDGTISIPSAVTNSKGTCGQDYKNVGTSTSNMTAASSISSGSTYYARYSKSVTNYYYNSSWTSRTIYRNQRVNGTSSTSMSSAVLSTSATGTSNYSTATGPGSSVWAGLATSATTTVAYGSVSDAATASATYSNLYTIYQFNVTFAKGTNTSDIGATSGSCKVTSSSTSCTVATPSISAPTGYSATGWSTAKDDTSGTTAGNDITLSTNAQTYYGNVKINTYDLVITGDSYVSAVSVKAGSTSGTSTTCTKSGTTFTCSSLTYGTNYYLYPTFSSGYEFSSWAKTDSATNASLGSTTTMNTYYKMGAGAGALTLTSKSSCSSTPTNLTGTMQTFSPSSSYCVGSSGTLTDSRDNTSYKVAKLADGKWWMLDNLRLDLVAKKSVLSSSNTNATDAELKYLKGTSTGTTSDKYATSGVISWPSSSSSSSYSVPWVAVSGNKDGGGTWNKNTTVTSYGSGSGKVGAYYNYCAASAGTYCYGNGEIPGTSSGNATADICPYGWRMPTGGSSGEYNALYTAYSSGASSFRTALSTPLSGGFSGGLAYNQGYYGIFWSSTWNNNSSMYGLYVNSSKVNPTDNNGRYGGNSVRCVLK